MTTTGPQRPDVRVVAVGVGAYQAGDGWTLTGPVDDAVRIARFFVAHGVPTGNVDLLTDPAPPADDLPAGVRRRPADRATVRQLLLRELPASSARELYVYWGGHGFVDPRRRRRLYYADATDADAVNLDLDSLLATYASDLVAVLHRQLWLVDVCQTHGPARPRRIDGHETFPSGDPVAGRSQDVLFAAAVGQPAANLDRQRTGLFSRELLRLMDADGLTALADPQRLAERLRARFTTLRADGLTGQTPTYLWYRDASGDEGLLLAADPGGSRKPVERPVRPSTAAIGAVVDALLEIPEFRRPNDREELLSLLPPSVYASIRRNPATRIDAVSTVRGCLHHATGLSELVAAVRFFTSDDAAVDHLAETVRRLAG
ncbi:hypothetical protein O7543_04025 [Solwaraspora sp. WMMA2080]|uniref:effector-associated domain 2-containing protein n=1 Tax=unclassified Solwaraspora TaxID=2627926 RepID=UPI00248ADFCD|nr:MULTISPECIES: hypothetical protein [unclassified Solwaraspora]WBB99793.1 hypothetical protein O7553_13345 [Solwaraspora sp. WMMA2059]WBC23632.1 hypothetical protein O7543_04025 [Solwaraspora sp. WMMA2080]